MIRSGAKRRNKKKEKWTNRLVAKMVEGSRCLVAVKHDALQLGKDD